MLCSVVQYLCTRLSETRSLVTDTMIFDLVTGANAIDLSGCKYRIINKFDNQVKC